MDSSARLLKLLGEALSVTFVAYIAWRQVSRDPGARHAIEQVRYELHCLRRRLGELNEPAWMSELRNHNNLTEEGRHELRLPS